MPFLRVAENRWQPHLPHEKPMTALEVMAARHGQDPTSAQVADTVTPIVNHGRWLIRCPFCPSACHASRTDLRFRCVECMSEADPWLTVAWPADADAIEQALSARPRPEFQNWAPPETVADLLAENAVYGVQRGR